MSAIILALVIAVILLGIALIVSHCQLWWLKRKLAECDRRIAIYHQALYSGDPVVFEREYKNFEEYLNNERS